MQFTSVCRERNRSALAALRSAIDKAGFDENKHPRAKDGKFTAGQEAYEGPMRPPSSQGQRKPRDRQEAYEGPMVPWGRKRRPTEQEISRIKAEPTDSNLEDFERKHGRGSASRYLKRAYKVTNVRPATMADVKRFTSRTRKRLILAMTKAGYNPDQPRDAHGRWSETGAGTLYPFSPGKKEEEARARLAEAHANFKQDEFDDVKVEAAIRRINAATDEVARLRAQRARDFESKTGVKAPLQPGTKRPAGEQPKGSTGEFPDIALEVLNNMRARDNFSAAQAAARRKEEADRLARQGQESRRNLGFEERMAGTGQSRYYYTQQQRTERGPRSGFAGSLADTAERIARATRQVSNIAANISGAASTRDYATIGSHLTFIHNDVNALRQELAGIPSDARRLRREATSAVNRLTNQLRSLRTAIATRMF